MTPRGRSTTHPGLNRVENAARLVLSQCARYSNFNQAYGPLLCCLPTGMERGRVTAESGVRRRLLLRRSPSNLSSPSAMISGASFWSGADLEWTAEDAWPPPTISVYQASCFHLY